MTYRLRPRARADLREIWRYTARTWSTDQADSYVGEIKSRIAQAAEMPALGSPLPDVPGEFRKCRSGRHLILYRQSTDDIVVVRVIHEREDVPEGLNDLP